MNAEHQRSAEPHQDQQDERPRWQQMFFEDIFLILMLGLVVPTIFYIVLGLMDLASVPMFQP